MQSDLQAMKSQLMNISQPEIMKTDSFTARNNNTPHIRPQFEPRQYNRPNSRSHNYYNQNSRPQMQSFPRPQIRQNQDTYQPSDRCGFCGMEMCALQETKYVITVDGRVTFRGYVQNQVNTIGNHAHPCGAQRWAYSN
jgi:hypothetical protein